MAQLTVYSRRGCHLCEVLLAELEPMLRGRATIEVVDIDTDPALRARYHSAIPVVMAGERELFRHRIDALALRRWLDNS